MVSAWWHRTAQNRNREKIKDMEIKDFQLGICSLVTSVPKTYLCTHISKSNGLLVEYLLVCDDRVCSIWSHKYFFVHKHFIKVRCNLFLFKLILCFHNVMQNSIFANSIQNQNLSTDISETFQEEQEFFPLSKNTCQVTLICECINV